MLDNKKFANTAETSVTNHLLKSVDDVDLQQENALGIKVNLSAINREKPTPKATQSPPIIFKY